MKWSPNSRLRTLVVSALMVTGSAWAFGCDDTETSPATGGAGGAATGGTGGTSAGGMSSGGSGGMSTGGGSVGETGGVGGAAARGRP